MKQGPEENSAAGRISAHAIQVAIEKAGSALALCAYLGVDRFTLVGWIAGEEEVPRAAFLRMVDIICEDLDAVERKALAAARRVAEARTSSDQPGKQTEA